MIALRTLPAIKAGDSIPKSIQSGIDKSDFMIILLSKDVIKSEWVEQEWMTKYGEKRQEQHTILLFTLIENVTFLLY